ncbi:MAG TPA: hypothetical protein VGZ22_21765 [Isosphaeraceae bacterium]|jgi:hypothetical protein|nr:hypothetical protein [Isosphaeraceae bacterium]
MDQMISFEGVIRLWCFAPPDIAVRISKTNERFRWARMSMVPREQRPLWTREFSGEAYTLCEAYGEYNGCLGYPGTTKSEPDRDNLKRAFRKKHRSWSEERISRAVESTIAKSLRQLSEGYFTSRAKLPAHQEVFEFLKSISAAGSVTMLLDDGGTVNRSLGGTSGLPDTHRYPRMAEAYSIDPAECEDKQKLPIPYWVPVIVRNS